MLDIVGFDLDPASAVHPLSGARAYRESRQNRPDCPAGSSRRSKALLCAQDHAAQAQAGAVIVEWSSIGGEWKGKSGSEDGVERDEEEEDVEDEMDLSNGGEDHACCNFPWWILYSLTKCLLPTAGLGILCRHTQN